MLGWEPHPGQLAFLRRPERYLGAVCGVRFGKSTLAARIAESEAMVPGARVWCVAPTYDLADKVFREVWDTFALLGATERTGSSRSKGIIVLPGGGFVQRKSADNPDSLIGEGLDAVIVDEFARMKRSVWDRELRARLADRRGRAFLISTPNGRGNWAYEEFTRWQLATKAGKPTEWWWHQAPSWENTIVFPGGEHDPEIEAQRAYYDEIGLSELFDQEFGAAFTAIVGRVFKKFNRKDHVASDAQTRAGVVRWWLGYDWGWDHPSALVLMGRTNAGQWRVVDEWAESGETFDAILSAAAKLCERNHVHREAVERLYYDPSRPEQGAAFRKAGWPATPGINDLAPGIVAIAEWLAKPDGLLLNGDRCAGAVVEFEDYRHPEANASGRLQVVKVRDDRLDAIRYVIASTAKTETAAGGFAIARAR